MEALPFPPHLRHASPPPLTLDPPLLHLRRKLPPVPSLPQTRLYASSSTSLNLTNPSLKEDVSSLDKPDKFDWYENWYPLAPVCDLDERVPHAKRVLGLDVVVWWDRVEGRWQVFDDRCPHRLAPLSEGRIDQWGRLQCVYHGWCFDGAGDCKLIPQAPHDGPPVHTFKKACAAVYPSCVQNKIVWFWPSTDPAYKDVFSRKKPPYLEELDDPSYTSTFGIREIPYGYEVLVENLMDPSHVPYAHHGIMGLPKRFLASGLDKRDREGGKPMVMSIETLSASGFFSKQERGNSIFVAPCLYRTLPLLDQSTNGSVTSEQQAKTVQKRAHLIFICIPVSPGNSRLIWVFPRNFSLWLDRVVPRWFFHIGQNLILDSDLYLLHIEERKIADVGNSKWHEACFVPTKSDALVVGFRRWLRKYGGNQFPWPSKFGPDLPSTPPREQLMDRYWSHVVHCSSCRTAEKGLKVVELSLQVISIGLVGLVAAMKQNALSSLARSVMITLAVASFLASKWLANFIYKTFHFHDYYHGLR